MRGSATRTATPIPIPSRTRGSRGRPGGRTRRARGAPGRTRPPIGSTSSTRPATIETLGSDLVGESGGPDVTIAVDPWGTDHRADRVRALGGGRRAAHAGGRRLAARRGGDRPDADVPRPRRAGPAPRRSSAPATRRIRSTDGRSPGRSTGRVDIATDGWDPGTYVVVLKDGASVAVADALLGRSGGRRPPRVDVETGVTGSATRSRCAGGTLPATGGIGWGCTSAAPIRTSPPTSRGSTRDRRSGARERSTRDVRGPVAPAARSIQRLPARRRRRTTSWLGTGFVIR